MPTLQKRKATSRVDDAPRLFADRFSPENRRNVSSPAIRTFNAIADLWGLDETERRLILGLPARSTYQNWLRTAREHRDLTLDVDVLTRISAILGIHKALNILFDTEPKGLAWLRGNHQAQIFGGHPPLHLITSGTQDALLTTRRFLDAARGGLYMAPNEIDADFPQYTDEDLVLS